MLGKKLFPSFLYHMSQKFLSLVLFICSSNISHYASAEKFSWHTQAGEYTDLRFGNKNVVRYVFERMKPDDRERTYKPFHHVFQSDGKGFLTKGPGGKFTHHRGIYYGFSKCSALNKEGSKVSVDTWHCKRGYQTHEKIIKQQASGKNASHKVEIAWRVDDGTVFAIETRSLSFSFHKDGSLIIDFNSILKTKQESVTLDGDPQHAGFQFRASNEVAESSANNTYYIRPNEGRDKNGATKNWPQNKEMTNIPWKAQSVVLNNDRYTTVYIDHPKNPKPSFYSERNYGRFGSYFRYTLTPTQPLTINYRLVIAKAERDEKECFDLHSEFIANTR